MSPRIRVLIVDDSAFARKVLRQILSSSPELEVVGTARDGLDALEKINELAPDVITLDLMMPNLDGLGVLSALPTVGAPRVIVVSISDADTELGAEALQAGAIDIVKKPTALATEQLYALEPELIAKVKLAAKARVPFLGTTQPAPRVLAARRHEVVVLGTSTGGPHAITRLLADLPANLPVPVVIALHIPAGYTAALAERLNSSSALEVREAEDGMLLRPGLVVLARGGAHVRVAKQRADRVVLVDENRGGSLHAPSVDILFESAAESFGAATLGVVLTGMGDDGTLGSGAIHRASGMVLTEAEASCVVYGMPRCVHEAGYSHTQVPLERMAAEIVRSL